MSERAKALVAFGVPVVWSNAVLPRLGLGLRGRTLASVCFACGYALIFRGAPNWLSTRGLRVGLGAATVVAAGYGGALAVAPVRGKIATITDRSAEVSTVEWVAVHIPIGTVHGEELIFRGTLNPLLDRAFGTRIGAVFGAFAFGLWHIHPARVAGDSVLGTVLATTAAGLVFGWLRRRGDSVTAPAAAHFTLNTGGAVAPVLARRLSTTR
ncbi:CPBP family intramembrane glutamic endopeptidase [Nocardia callitridis]|uniref:CAAX prenyl protease 2/Lysostaphin resistance protein A-like domain-containing protein n=1 Tax=Nocardia callitridis TaxID=648753 RepID=A0ABP9JW67_9NOCA